MVGAGRLVENVLNIGFEKGRVQSLESCAHSLRLVGSDAEPEQVHLLGECRRINEHSVVVGLGIQFPISEHEHPARSTEAANVREQIHVIKRDLERLHATHREAGHGAMVAIRKCAEVGVDKRDEGLGHIVFKGRRQRTTGHGFIGIGRKRLLNILQRRCEQLGVELVFEREVESDL